VIEAIDLTVRRRGRAVLDAVSFDVRPGQVTGVLGGTGAGKTTLLRRMVQLDRGGGETLFDGRPYRALVHPMREVGLVLEDAAGYPDDTVRGHLRLVLATDRRAAVEPAARGWLRRAEQSGGRFGQSAEGVLAVRDAEGNRIAVRSRAAASDAESSHAPKRRGNTRRGRTRPSHRIDAVLDIVGLSGQSRTRIADLTSGMATRLALAAALLGDPMALLLDCPDRGLEPEGVAWLGDLLRAFTSQGRAALVTCSDTETVARLSDRILLLDSGCLVGTRTSEEVLRAPAGAAVVVRSPQIVRFAALLAEAGARSSQSDGASLEVRGLDRARIGDLAYRHGVPLHELAERFTGTDPGDVVLAACAGRGRAIVPLQSATRPTAGMSAGARKVDAGAAAGASARAQLGVGGRAGTRADAEARMVAGAPESDSGAALATEVLATQLGAVRVGSGAHGAAVADRALSSDAGVADSDTVSASGASGRMSGPGAAAVSGAAGRASGPNAAAGSGTVRRMSSPGAGAASASASASASGSGSDSGSGSGAVGTESVAEIVGAVAAGSVTEFANADTPVPRPGAGAVAALGAELERETADATSQHVDIAESAAAASESDADA
jgi:ABC-type multidrug transport system ATPase subunit